MGLLTGEFFANEKILEPFALFVTGIFGKPHAPILKMMPSSDPSSITRMFSFFGFTIAVGFIINTCGIVINIINNFSLKRFGRAIFSKTGITGAIFFWYVIAFALRVAFFKHSPAAYDWIIIGGSLFFTAFGEVFQRIVDGERPILENGLFSAIIGAVVEIIEVISSYLSNTVSFVRVGAFALAHAVLGYIINSLVEITPGVGGIVVAVAGNAIVVVLEGMIVAIQVVRLQYYEFFSKFFSETGREFKPFAFSYKK
jgi:V/A-type H+-transporting ATPase subunit I